MATDPATNIPSQDAKEGASGHAVSLEQGTFNVGTRQSTLALAQVEIVLSTLRPRWPGATFEIRKLHTAGDKDKVTALHAMTSTSIWTTELEAELSERRTDFVVHSLKDVPTKLPAEFVLGAALSRTEPRDCVVMSPTSTSRGFSRLSDLPEGSVIGTSSVRRLAQIRRRYPHLKVEDVRGNIDTRLKKLDAEAGPFQALILAAAGLQRIGIGHRISSFLSRKEGGWLTAVGQGAVGVEIRKGDERAEALCRSMIGDKDGEAPGTGNRTFWECLAERAMLRELEGGCTVPVAVEAEWETDQLVLYSTVISLDGQQCADASVRRKVGSAEDAEAVGLEMAKLLMDKGAMNILDEITKTRMAKVEASSK